VIPAFIDRLPKYRGAYDESYYASEYHKGPFNGPDGFTVRILES